MDRRLLALDVENFRSLRDVSLPLRPLNVLVGPNGAGKTNVLEVFRFLSDVIRADLEPALAWRGGFDGVVFRGGVTPPESIGIKLTATWTAHSTIKAPDKYVLRIERGGVARRERFEFTRAGGRGRRIEVRHTKVTIADTGGGQVEERTVGLHRLSSGLSTLPRLSDEEGGPEVAVLAGGFASCRVFDVDVATVRRPARIVGGTQELLEHDAANLAAFLLNMRGRHETAWNELVDDAAQVLPQLRDIDFEFPSGAAREAIVVLNERGLRRPTQLADASYGTIRLLGLLAMLYDPNPPALTCVEEIDHGLHPQALELLVHRLREASARTQFLIATHSPAMADRLKPEELVICERHDDGSSVIPAISTEKMREIVRESEDTPLGELWFSGALGGDL
ncbi:AAA family ATPase [Actinokineospora iranica]|uniref:Predicted ATPase n=1 Tax=Actinokineospora iranica TaxID=1271860 RepID=A0A1G6R7M7_9PSEU|nr:AAA family ATPase [Actinokineospora iranica]SDD00518.1 Predicted ATPase [Actinokineospora iranica]